MKHKKIEWSYPSSPNAKKLGFGKHGCFSVQLAKPGGYKGKALRGFMTLAEAEEYAVTLPNDWSPLSLRMEPRGHHWALTRKGQGPDGHGR